MAYEAVSVCIISMDSVSSRIENGSSFEELERLTEDIASGEASEDQASREAMRWQREDAHGSLTLAEAAILALRHEAGT